MEDTYTVEIKKTPGATSIGLVVGRCRNMKYTQELDIKTIKEGLIQNYNNTNPPQKVREGDRIVAVEGLAGDTKVMVELLDIDSFDQTISLVCRRMGVELDEVPDDMPMRSAVPHVWHRPLYRHDKSARKVFSMDDSDIESLGVYSTRENTRENTSSFGGDPARATGTPSSMSGTISLDDAPVEAFGAYAVAPCYGGPAKLAMLNPIEETPIPHPDRHLTTLIPVDIVCDDPFPNTECLHSELTEELENLLEQHWPGASQL